MKMIGTGSSLRTSLAWLKAQFGVEHPTVPERRRGKHRKRMRFEAELQRVGEVVPAVGVDIHEDGARVLCTKGWEPGTVLFLRLTEVQLGGFAEVRHCTLRKDKRYAIGMAFRGPLIPQGATWQVQRVVQPSGDGWTKNDDRPIVPDEPREVA